MDSKDQELYLVSSNSNGVSVKMQIGNATNYFEYNAVIGAEVSIPCNITPPTPEDSISLVLWYKGDSGNPIYSVDARNVPAVAASHFASKQLGSRALFNMSNRIATLTIRPVKEDDGGEYRCRVDFRRARTQNRVMKLTIIVPPKNLTIRDDKNRTVSGVIGPYQEGATISLMCEAHGGRPAPVLSWWNGSKMIDDGYTPIGRGVVRNELLLLNLQREDLSATLTCQASNTNLTVPVSSSVTIDLSLAPQAVNIVTAYRPLSAGKELEVVCQTHGARPPARISWWVGSDNLDQLARESISIDGNTTTSYLLLHRTSEDNGKILICRAQNPDLPNSALQDKWILNIYFVPQLSLALGGSQQYGYIREGGNAYFDCNILANPPVTDVKWRFQSEELQDDPSKGVIIGNHSLQLKNVSRNNRGKYQCFATNVEGEGRSEEVPLRVQFAPVCRSGQKMVYGIARHEDANITCEVDADPAEVYFSWTFNNSAENIDIISNNNGGTKSTARYIPRTKMDYGVLYCRGRNIIGMQRDPCIFTIIPTGPPEPLQNCTIINQTASTLIVGCEAGDDGGLQQTFHLEVYGLAAEQLLVNMTAEDGPVFVAQGLTSGSSYVLVVYSANNKGRSTSVALTASTIYSAEQRTGDEQPLAISAVLAVLMGLVGALVLLAIVIIFIMKTRGENDSSDMHQEHDQHEKIPAPITKQFEDDSPDVIPSKPFCTDYGNITPNATTERIYENVGEKDHTYENIISRVHFVPKEPYDDITYAELALPDNQQPFARHRLEPPTEYADIDFQNSRGTFPECQAVDDDDSARSPLVKPSPGGRVIPEDCPVSLSAV